MSKIRIHVGDAIRVLETLPAKSVHCVATSPPYYALRDYGVDGQLGQEASPREYVENMVRYFRGVHRVLRDDGVTWLNLGDSYAGSPPGNAPGEHSTSGLTNPQREELCGRAQRRERDWGVKDKDLVGIPWAVAFALRDDGWYLRRDVIWSKGSCKPESVQDRPTTSHEYVFLLTKRPSYYYDADAIREGAVQGDTRPRDRTNSKASNTPGQYRSGGSNYGLAASHLYTTRNARSVWNINPQPFKGAHFATFPPALAERMILAGTSAHGACAACGAPYERIVEKGDPLLEQQQACGGDEDGEYDGEATKEYDGTGAENASDLKRRILAGMVERKTVGWRQTCNGHVGAGVVPCVVLDPFGGAGTVGLVADRLGRDAILIELNPANAELSRKRIAEEAPMFSSVEVVDS